MKGYLSFFSFLAMSVACYAQAPPRSTQYIFNNYLINPAISGVESYMDLKMGYRQQWTGLEGAPVTKYVSFHAPVGGNYIRGSVNSFGGQGENPMSRSYVNSYTSAESHHGVGFHALSDKAGRLRQTNVSATYAYHIGLSQELNLSLGVSAGFSSLNIDVENVKVIDTTDPLLSADNNNRIRPDLGAGLWLYGPRYFAGISARQLLGDRLKNENAQQTTLLYQNAHFYGTIGYKFFLMEDIALIPSSLISYSSNSPLTLDANLKMAFRDIVWIGGGFRNGDSYSLLAGFNVLSLVNLSYSYDVNVSKLQNMHSNTHEIVLGILLNNRYEVSCAQF